MEISNMQKENKISHEDLKIFLKTVSLCILLAIVKIDANNQLINNTTPYAGIVLEIHNILNSHFK